MGARKNHEKTTGKSASKSVSGTKTTGVNTQLSHQVQSGKILQYPVIAVILLIVFIVFSKSFSFDFLNWDDNLLVTESPWVRAMAESGTDAVKGSVREYLENNIVTIASHAFIYKYWGLNPVPYHVTNVLLHLVNTLLVFIFIRLLTNRWEAAALAALLFALHPMRVESVAWVAERKDVLYAMFYLAGIVSYIYYIKKHKVYYLLATFILFPFSLFSKFAAVTFPFALFLTDYYFNRKISLITVLEKVPFFILLLVAGFIQFTSPVPEGAVESVTASYTRVDRVFFATYSFDLYFLKFFVPYKLSALYPYPLKTGGTLPVDFFVSAIFALMIITGFIILIKFIKTNRREYIFSILFFLLNIFLVMHFVSFGGNVVAADRYTYMAHIGLILPLALLFCNAIDKINPFFVKYRLLLFSFFSIMVLSCIILTWHGLDRFKNSLVLFNDVIEKNQTAGVAYSNRGLALEKGKDYVNALKDYNKVIEINPEFAIGYYNRGVIKGKLNDFDGAYADYNLAIKYNPSYSEAYQNRGLIESRNKRNFKAAINDFTKAVQFNPKFKEAYKNRAVAAFESGDYQSCLADMDKVVYLDPADHMNYFIRGHAENNLGMKQDACNDWNIALKKGNTEAAALIAKNCK